MGQTEIPQNIGFIFIDGLGIGVDDANINPCCQTSLFRHCLGEEFPKRSEGNGWVAALDAVLNVPGLPQSATGQASLFTGENVAARLGRHLQGFPNENIRRILARGSLLKWFKNECGSAAFLNAFRPPFFDYDPHRIIRYLSVTSVCNLYAHLPFFRMQDIEYERSVYHDLTNEALRARGYDLPVFTPEKAGQIVADAISRYPFTLFEYFNSDRAGHSLDSRRARAEMGKLERFLSAVLDRLDLKRMLLVVTSDHGNIEDMSCKSHTRNPVPALFFGIGSDRLARQCHSITDVAPSLIRTINGQKRLDNDIDFQ